MTRTKQLSGNDKIVVRILAGGQELRQRVSESGVSFVVVRGGEELSIEVEVPEQPIPKTECERVRFFVDGIQVGQNCVTKEDFEIETPVCMRVPLGFLKQPGGIWQTFDNLVVRKIAQNPDLETQEPKQHTGSTVNGTIRVEMHRCIKHGSMEDNWIDQASSPDRELESDPDSEFILEMGQREDISPAKIAGCKQKRQTKTVMPFEQTWVLQSWSYIQSAANPKELPSYEIYALEDGEGEVVEEPEPPANEGPQNPGGVSTNVLHVTNRAGDFAFPDLSSLGTTPAANTRSNRPNGVSFSAGEIANAAGTIGQSPDTPGPDNPCAQKANRIENPSNNSLQHTWGHQTFLEGLSAVRIHSTPLNRAIPNLRAGTSTGRSGTEQPNARPAATSAGFIRDAIASADLERDLSFKMLVYETKKANVATREIIAADVSNALELVKDLIAEKRRSQTTVISERADMLEAAAAVKQADNRKFDSDQEARAPPKRPRTALGSMNMS